MPQPKAITAAQDQVRKVADMALADLEGVTITFTPDKFGTHANCGSRARGFQCSFASMRARNRLSVARTSKTHEPSSVYDQLLCQRYELPNEGGWKVTLTKNTGIGEDWDIISNATGASVTQKTEYDSLSELFAKDQLSFWSNEALMKRMIELQPDFKEFIRSIAPNIDANAEAWVERNRSFPKPVQPGLTDG